MTDSESSARSPSDASTHDASDGGAGAGGATSGDQSRWVALVALGDRQAFAEMFRAFAERLAAYAYSIVGSRETAEEVVQDVFFAIWQRREQWLVRGTLTQYLYGSTRNRALDVLKARRVRRRFDLRAGAEDVPPAMATPAAEPGAALERAEVRAHVHEALDALPEQQRAVVRLRWLDRLSHGEIAAVLGISVKTSENHANRAMQRLRRLLLPFRP